jgi:hypothetical protein
MRSKGLGLLLLVLAIFAPGSAQAGIYNPGESEETATYPDYMDSRLGKNFRDVIFILRSIPLEHPQVDNPVRRRYVFAEELIGKTALGVFKMEDDYLQRSAVLTRREKFTEAEQLLRPFAVALEASAVLIRRGKFKEAEGLLRPLAVMPQERDNIPLQSNFATALHMAGELQGAYGTLRPVVKEWDSWDKLSDARKGMLMRIGWSEPIYDLNRVYDTYYLKLLRLRKSERIAKKDSKFLVQLPDALFDDGKDPPSPVRFLNDDGDFEAGKIAASEWAKLPHKAPDALAIVQQLVVWMPNDLRLYWLLGEVYNAQNNETASRNRAGILAALQIFTELSAVEASDEVKKQLKVRIGVLLTAKEQFDRENTGILEKGLVAIEKKNAPGFAVDWRTVGISFALGFVLAFFVLWQVREIQRRRMAR